MLTGPDLGAAIERARKLKGVTKADMAKAFDVKPPSIQDWVKRGTIDKARLQPLWAYFADVVGPEHWGLKAYPWAAGAPAVAAEPAADYYQGPAAVLLQLQALLKSVPAAKRAEMGQLLDVWARAGGADHFRHAAEALLSTGASGKQRNAA